MALQDITKGGGEAIGRLLSDEQLKKIQSVLLMELCDLQTICLQKNIKFVLIGGSAIGALRHHGFIPWDDDVDIAMTRADYEVLAQEIRESWSHKYTVSDAQDENNHGKNIPKIRLKGTVYRTFLESGLDECGLRVDIFVIENIYDNLIARILHGFLCMILGFITTCLRIRQDRTLFYSMSKSLSLRVKSFFGGFFSFLPLNTLVRWLDKCHGLCKNSNSKYVSVPSDVLHYFGEIMKRSDICEVQEAVFENVKMFVPKEYDSYLRKRYGNYMEKPPVAKQVRSYYLEYDLGIYEK